MYDTKNQDRIAFGFVHVVWGSTFVAIRYPAQVLNPALFSSLRFFIAAAALITVLAGRRQSLRIDSRVREGGVPWLLMFTVITALVNYASRTIPAGFTALVLATIPLSGS